MKPNINFGIKLIYILATRSAAAWICHRDSVHRDISIEFIVWPLNEAQIYLSDLGKTNANLHCLIHEKLYILLTGGGGGGVNNFCLLVGYRAAVEISLLYDNCLATFKMGRWTQTNRNIFNIFHLIIILHLISKTEHQYELYVYGDIRLRLDFRIFSKWMN